MLCPKPVVRRNIMAVLFVYMYIYLCNLCLQNEDNSSMFDESEEVSIRLSIMSICFRKL